MSLGVRGAGSLFGGLEGGAGFGGLEVGVLESHEMWISLSEVV